MPTVALNRDRLFEALGQTFTDEQFDELCFRFGIELDDITSEKEIVSKGLGTDKDKVADSLSSDIIYKIDVPANRYDLLCLEGMARALRIFLGKESIPEYKINVPAQPLRIVRKKETADVRPFVVGAVLRNVTLDQARFDSFIDLQDKLHQNIGRKRTLVAIGTHDLDTIQGPFTYTAKKQGEIEFRPLYESKAYTVDQLFAHYRKPEVNSHLRPYLHITEHAPLHPVIYDSKDIVLSLPPIINGQHSAMSIHTKNILIECTGTDFTKLNITLNMIVAMFSQYCAEPFSVEAVEVVYESDEEKEQKLSGLYPKMESTAFEVRPEYINRGIGVELDMSPEEMCKLLGRMQLPTTYDESKQSLIVTAPCTRPDILHAVDVQEDVAIAYGYNNIKRTVPKVPVLSAPQPLNKLSDLVREVVAQAGYLEVLTFALISHDENFAMMGVPHDQGLCVRLANPKTAEFNCVRTSLLPGLLKTLNSNKAYALPIKVFELSDVVVQDEAHEVGAKNQRRLGAMFCGTTSGLEYIHGLLDRIMLLVEAKLVRADSAEAVEAEKQFKLKSQGQGQGQTEAKEKKQDGKKKDDKKEEPKKEKEAKESKQDLAPSSGGVFKYRHIYYIRPVEHPSFFSGRSAEVYLDGQRIGIFGILHPKVVDAFQIGNAVSALELDVEPLL